MRVQYRWGGNEADWTGSQVGDTAVPSLVRKTAPLAWPTHIVPGSPAARASALISDPPVPGAPIGSLIDCQLGPELGVLAVWWSCVTHPATPPASSRSGVLGSSAKGAPNSALAGSPAAGGMAP